MVRPVPDGMIQRVIGNPESGSARGVCSVLGGPSLFMGLITSAQLQIRCPLRISSNSKLSRFDRLRIEIVYNGSEYSFFLFCFRYVHGLRRWRDPIASMMCADGPIYRYVYFLFEILIGLRSLTAWVELGLAENKAEIPRKRSRGCRVVCTPRLQKFNENGLVSNGSGPLVGGSFPFETSKSCHDSCS